MLDNERTIIFRNNTDDEVTGRFFKIDLPFLGGIDLSGIINQAVNRGTQFLRRISRLESNLIDRNLFARPGSTEFAHSRFFGSNPRALDNARDGSVWVETALQVANE